MNQFVMTASSELAGDLFARSGRAVNISLVMGLHRLAISSSLSLARRIFELMFAQSNKSAGMLMLRSQNKVFIASIYS
jgi:hypothetical protein